MACAGAEKYTLLTAAARHRMAPDLYAPPGVGEREAEAGIGERVRESEVVALTVCVDDGVEDPVGLALPVSVGKDDFVGDIEGVGDVECEMLDGIGVSVELEVAVRVVEVVPVGEGVAEREGVEVDEAEPVLESEPLTEGDAEGVTVALGVSVAPAATDVENAVTHSAPVAGSRHVAHRQKGPVAPFPLLMENV